MSGAPLRRNGEKPYRTTEHCNGGAQPTLMGWAFNPRCCTTIVVKEQWWKFANMDPLEYFDPGNTHYTQCFHALFGPTPSWNNETVGDIIESLLGLLFIVRHRRDYPTLSIKAKDVDLIAQRVPLPFAHFMHDWCRAVFRMIQSTAWKETYTDLFARIKAYAENVQMKVSLPCRKRVLTDWIMRQCKQRRC